MLNYKVFCRSILVTVLLYSCNWDPSFKDESYILGWEDESAPLSSGEIAFQDSLTALGFPTQIERKYIGRRGDGQSPYYVKVNCDKLFVTANNIDSLERFRREILNNLYSKVITDSVIHDLNMISVDFNNLKFEKGLDRDKFFFGINYIKDSLEEWNGFKVKKYGKSKFERIQLNR